MSSATKETEKCCAGSSATVTKTITETPDAVSLVLDIPEWPGHRAGQHVDVRFTAEDGYSAERSYSIASSPGRMEVELSIVRLDDGEVSPYLAGLADGDQFELRGPIGGYFVWEKNEMRPVLLLGGGSGVVPLMSMLRYHAELRAPSPMRLVYSARTEPKFFTAMNSPRCRVTKETWSSR